MRARIAKFGAAVAFLLIVVAANARSQPDPCPTGTEPACAGQWSAPINFWAWTPPNPGCAPPIQPSCVCQNPPTGGPCREVAHTVLLVGLPAGAPSPWAVLFWRVGPQRPEQAWIWQPGTTTVNTVEVVDPGDPAIPNDHRCGVIFCGGHARFPDGKIVVVDGTRTCGVGATSAQCPNDPLNVFATDSPHGTQESWLFDPGLLTGPPATWQPWRRLQDLNAARWYPTVLTMANGDVTTGGGLTSSEACTGGNTIWADSAEWLAWNGGAFSLTSPWQPGPGLPGTSSFGTFPHLFLFQSPTTSADIFLSAHDGVPFNSLPSPSFLNTNWAWRFSRTNQADTVSTANNPLFQRSDGTSAPVPGFADRFALVGGQRNINNDPAGIAVVETIQSPQTAGTWSSTTYGSLNLRRLLNHTIVLPEGSLLTVGGMDQEYRIPGAPFQELRHAELLDPSSPGALWQLMAPAAHRRPYHAGAILLPDGTVLVTGGEFYDAGMGGSTTGSLLPTQT